MPTESTSIFLSWPTISYILGGTVYTVGLICGAMALGLILGVPMAAFSVYGPRWMKRCVNVYVWFFRGVPILTLLFLIYFGLFPLIETFIYDISDLRLNIPSFAAALLTLGLASGAYQSQIFRGAMLSLPAGQFKAAKALGMSHTGAIKTIIIPQAIRVAIPAWSNEYSILLKDSAVAFVLGTMEIMARVEIVAKNTYNYMPLYILAGLIYFILTWLGVSALKKLDKKIRTPGLAHEASGPGYY